MQLKSISVPFLFFYKKNVKGTEMPNSVMKVKVSNYYPPLYHAKLHATQPNFGKSILNIPPNESAEVKKTAGANSNNSIPKKETQKQTSKILYAVGGVLVGAGVTGAVLLATGRRNSRIITSLQEQCQRLSSQVSSIRSDVAAAVAEKNYIQETLDNTNRTLQETRDLLQKAQTDNESLTSRLNGILESPSGKPEDYVDTLVNEYRKVAKNATLDYKPLEPFTNGKAIVRTRADNLYIPFEIMPVPSLPQKIDGCIYPDDMIAAASKLKEGETYTVPFLLDSQKINAKQDTHAYLTSDEITRFMGKHTSDKVVSNAANWDKSKIARDILQNFYDGHGHTLDGVRMLVTKNPDGSFTIRIEGKATYRSRYLRADGLSSKGGGNLYDAGGFGEGAKMVNVSLFAQRITDKIRYGSADWTYEFAPDENYDEIYRTLSRTRMFDGNFVEFKTRDNVFVNKLLEAVNYFEHSRNPDFQTQNLMYQNPDMGIAFLGKKHKGNIYVTQRFAYGADDKYSEGMDGLTMFFRRKTEKFSQGRDRVKIVGDTLNDDILDEFVKEISYEDARNIILRMQSCWEKEDGDITKKAYKVLLKKLCDKFSMDSSLPQIDLTQQKFAAKDCMTNADVIRRLHEYGYTLCDDFFANIGMPTASQVLSLYSAHTALKPTQKEIQKINLLGEAVKIVQELYGEAQKKIAQEIVQCGDKGIFIPEIDGKENSMAYSDKIKAFITAVQSVTEDGASALKQELPLPKNTNVNLLIKYHTQEEAKEYLLFVKKVQEKFVKILSNYENSSNEEKQFVEFVINELCDTGLLDKIIDPNVIQKFTDMRDCISGALIKEYNPKSPVFIFDRTKEVDTDTLGEAMTKGRKYLGHWVDRGHLNTASFTDLLATWLHEMLHQYAGDSNSLFGYKLTDLLGDTFKLNPDQHARLNAIEKVFNEISQQS